MRAMSNEPSMEEILSSIKRIIAEEDIPAQGARAPRRAAVSRFAAPEAQADEFADDDQILELTEALSGDIEAAHEEMLMAKPETPAAETPAKADPRPAKAARSRPAAAPAAATAPDVAPAAGPATPAPAVMSDLSAEAARESLVSLSRLLVRADDGQSNTLEGLVREMLRPVLKEWLDANLPELVEAMVKREIDRITGRV
ncbi:MAG TPA: DUF2497 domain-containing protein [Sphingobium sp.]|nr:DUF2497 domain-containing protein [Sphingobium sp.]